MVNPRDFWQTMVEMLNIGEAKQQLKVFWLTRICEMHNGVLEESMRNIKDDVGKDLQTAISWEVSAKNNLDWYKCYTQNTKQI